MGQQSYGKGSVQGIFQLNVGGGGVRLTTAKFYSPDGSPISQVGVTPEVPVQLVARENPEAETNSDSEDDTLRIAINIAKANLQGQRPVANTK